MKPFTNSARVSAFIAAAVISISSSAMAEQRSQRHYEYSAKWQPHACDSLHLSKHEAKRCAKHSRHNTHEKKSTRYNGHEYGQHDNQGLWAKAPVTHIAPIFERVQYFREEKSCGYYEERGRLSSKGNDSITDELIGGVIGGAIGNAIGANSTNKKIQAVIGAAIGASIAHDLNQRKGYDGKVSEQYRCTKKQVPYYKDEQTGYQVTYHYQGREYRTVMDEHPGKHVRVRLQLAEVYP